MSSSSDGDHGPYDDLGGWDEDDCHGDCDNCDDELCKGVDDMLGDFFEDEDEDGVNTWSKYNV